MPVIALIIATFTAVLQVWIFALESILWTRPDVWGRVGVKSQDEADAVSRHVSNQGFFNLFLALGLFAGLIMGHSRGGHAIVAFCCLSIVGAAIVLATMGKGYLRAAFLQGILPTLTLVAALVL